MIKPHRHFLNLLPLAGLLLLAACPQMTTGALGGAGTPLSATGERTSSSSTTTDTDKGSVPDDMAAPSAAAPLPPPGGGDAGGLGGAGSGSSEYSAMMRHVPADGAPEGSPSEPITVARDSGGGVLGAPSTGERLEFPDFEIACNVMAVIGPASGRAWRNYEDFLREMADGSLNTGNLQSICDIAYSRDTDAQTIEHFHGTTLIGYYLFFRAPAGQNFEGRSAGDSKMFASVEELRTALAGTTYIGDKLVMAQPSIYLTPEMTRQLTPTRDMPGLRDGISPIVPLH